MELLCARLSCRLEAAASLQFNTDDAQVIIIDLTDPTGGIPLCSDHVKTRTAPMGWTMVDQRLGLPPRRHLESVPQPELSMSISSPTRPGPDDTSSHPASGDISDRVSSEVVAPSVPGPAKRPSLRRPVDRGFPWEWAQTEPQADDSGDSDSGDADTGDFRADYVDSDDLGVEDNDVSDGGMVDDEPENDGMGPSGVDTTSKPSTPLLSRAFRNNPIDPDEAS